MGGNNQKANRQKNTVLRGCAAARMAAHPKKFGISFFLNNFMVGKASLTLHKRE